MLYGKYIVWDKDMIQTGKVQEDIDVTSATIPINKADLAIVDVNSDFDIGNDDGAWKSIQKTQEIILTEYRNGIGISIGAFYVDDFSFSKNVAGFKLIDAIGLMDKYTFYDGQIYENERAENILHAVFAAAGIKKYTIATDVADITLTGYLGVKTCRKALQQICFACGAVADDSRSDTIRVYKPDKYVSATVGTDRKFNGCTKVSLDKYISGISIECKKYSLEDKDTEIYKDTLQSGDTKLTFTDPYLPSSVTVSAGAIKEVKTNYIVVSMAETGQCTIVGRKYASNAYTYHKDVDMLSAGETENKKKYNGCTLYNTDLICDVAENLLKYYAMQKKLDMKYLQDKEQVGNWVNVREIGGHMATTLIESQSVDLTGGYIATAKCRGYSVVTKDPAYTGEIYAGERGLI